MLDAAGLGFKVGAGGPMPAAGFIGLVGGVLAVVAGVRTAT